MRLPTSVSERSTAGPSTVLEWALWAAERGWAVIPVSRAGKHPLLKHWPVKASTDSDQLQSWFEDNGRNYGIACGGSDLLVVDEDEPGGFAAYAATIGVEVPETFTVTTGRGRHFYFATGGQPLGSSPGPLKAYGCDIRAGRSQVVGPGSTHESGARYLPVNADADVAPLPDWLEEALRLPTAPTPRMTATTVHVGLIDAYAQTALDREIASVREATEGHRNDSLNRAALNLYQLVVGGSLPEAATKDALLSAALDCGLAERESLATIESGFRKGAERPRSSEALTTTDTHAWKPLDLGSWFDSPPEPAERFGSGQMLYRGAVHWLAGEPESGKSMLMLHWALEEMRAGRNVVLLDEEAGGRDVLPKLVALGATRQQVDDHLTYLPPSGRNILREAARLRDVVTETHASFVGIDGAAVHLALADLNEDTATDVTKFMARAIMPLAHDLGAAVVVLDHMTKSQGGSNRYARGSGAKLAKTDAAFFVEAVEPFSKLNSGRLRITSQKDRHGDYGRNVTWNVSVTTGDGRIALDISSPSDEEIAAMKARASRGPNPAKDQATRVALVSFLKRNPGASTRAIRDQKFASRQAGDRVIAAMVQAGEIRREEPLIAGDSVKHFLNEEVPLLPAEPGGRP